MPIKSLFLCLAIVAASLSRKAGLGAAAAASIVPKALNDTAALPMGQQQQQPQPQPSHGSMGPVDQASASLVGDPAAIMTVVAVLETLFCSERLLPADCCALVLRSRSQENLIGVAYCGMSWS